MIRGDIYLATLDPSQGFEQAGTRLVIVVTRDAINKTQPNRCCCSLDSMVNRKRLLPSHVEIKVGEGGLNSGLGGSLRAGPSHIYYSPTKAIGHLSATSISQLNDALKIALDLP